MGLFSKSDQSDSPNSARENISTVSEDINPRQQIKYGRPAEASAGLFSEYCDNCSIHGVRYLGEQKRHLIERIFWAVAIIACLVICSLMIRKTYVKWDESPVIVSFAEKSTPIWRIPFPAVTICPVTKARKSVFNYTDAYCRLKNTSINGNVDYFMDALSQVCSNKNILDSELHTFGTEISPNNSIVEALAEAAPKFDELFDECRWQNNDASCSKIFHRTVTEEGICYSFNALSPSEVYRPSSFYQFDYEHPLTDWTLEDGYENISDETTYPERVFGSGDNAGLYVQIGGSIVNRDHLCKGSIQGFKVILHTAGVRPSTSKNYVHVPFGQEVVVKVRPNMIETMPTLKNYKPDRRMCYFKHERYLQHFKVYTQSNCRLECIANFTLANCGCVKFSMPRLPSTKVCGAKKLKCVKDSEDTLSKLEFFETHGLSKKPENHMDCHCLPTCTTISYDQESSLGEFDVQKLVFTSTCGASSKEIAEEYQMSRFVIFFNEEQFITSRRSELYGFTDFLGTCGGLLGLFMGVSLLSLVEICYYCTVRLGFNLKMRFDIIERRKFNQSLEKNARNSICNAGKE